jgi:hypothetical protein
MCPYLQVYREQNNEGNGKLKKGRNKERKKLKTNNKSQ